MCVVRALQSPTECRWPLWRIWGLRGEGKGSCVHSFICFNCQLGTAQSQLRLESQLRDGQDGQDGQEQVGLWACLRECLNC